jgi:hypothetical protein
VGCVKNSRQAIIKKIEEQVTMNTNQETQQPFNLLILLVFIFFLTNQLLFWLVKDFFSNGLNTWVYTDWLIDYSAGFVRRGLSGELIRAAAGIINPYQLSVILSWSLYFSLIITYLYLIIRNLTTIPSQYLLVVLFLPSLILFYLFDHAALGRKEMLGFLFVFIHLLIVPVQIKKPFSILTYLKYLWILTFLLLPIHIFIHEASLFLFIPVHLMISWSVFSYQKPSPFIKKFTILLLTYAPVAISFLIIFFWGRPDFSVAQTICQNWEAAQAFNQGACQSKSANLMWALPGAFTALPWNISQANSLPSSLSTPVLLTWLSVFFLFSLTTLFYLGRVSTLLSLAVNKEMTVDSAIQRRHSAMIRFKYFFIPVICTLPLYLLGWDFGRWFAVSSINFALIALSKELEYLEMQILPAKDSLIQKLVNIHDSIIPSRTLINGTVVLIFSLFILFYLRLPHCCITETNFAFLAEPLRSIMSFIVK